jgi:hypothetical protein
MGMRITRVKTIRVRDLVMRIQMTERTQALDLNPSQKTDRQIAAPGATTAVRVQTKTIMTIVTTAAAATIIVAAASMIIAAVASMKTVGAMTTVATAIVVVAKMVAAATAAVMTRAVVEEITAAPGVVETIDKQKRAEAAQPPLVFYSL